MRIAIIGGEEFPIPAIRGGAIQTLVTSIIDENEIHNNNMDITVLTKADKDLQITTSDYQNTKVVELKSSFVDTCLVFINRVLRKLTGYRIKYTSTFMLNANRYLKRNTYFDIIFYESSALSVMQAKKFGNEKTVFHVHADYLNNQTVGINDIRKKVDLYVAVSEFIKKQLELISGFENKTIVLKNAVDTNGMIIDRENNRRQIRDKYNFSNQDIVLIYCSRLSKEKGILELIKAIPKEKKIKLLVVGGENFSSNYVSDYVRLLYIEAEKRPEQVYFTGYVPHRDIGLYLSAADIAVVPSVCNEAASLTLLEFRNYGLPTIASRVGGIPEYCSNDTTLLVNYDDHFIENLSNAIWKLCNDNNLRNKLAINAKLDLDYYSYSAYYRRFYELCCNIIGGCYEYQGKTK